KFQRQRRRRLLGVGLAWAVVAGCAPHAPPAPVTPAATPSFGLRQLRLEPPIDGLARAVLDLVMLNPNPWPVTIDRVDYALVLNGTLLGAQAEPVGVEVAPRSEAWFTLRLPYPDQLTVASFRRRHPPRGLSYAVRGEAWLHASGLERAPIRLEGSRAPLVTLVDGFTAPDVED
ncbi:MAG: LEA type 2 family protein, partial [Pseudomonadota bacterium]